MPRTLLHPVLTLPNHVTLEAQDFDMPKGRYWKAWRDLSKGRELIGEFKTWQETKYVRQSPERYGTGEAQYISTQIRSSWITPEKPDQPDSKRLFHDWRRALKELPVGVKRTKASPTVVARRSA